MDRLFLPELEDFRWLPRWYRDSMTDCLQALSFLTSTYRHTVPLLDRLLGAVPQPIVRDFGSGATGPLLELAQSLQQKYPALEIIFSDLYPNEDAASRNAAAAREKGLRVHYDTRSVDMSSPPSDRESVRTIYTAFHHLDRGAALRTLKGAVDAKVPIGVFEVTGRSPLQLMMTIAIPFLILAVTPFIRGRRLQRFVFTYLIPLIPLGCFWDGLVSNLRTFSVDELRSLAAELETSEQYFFEAGTFPTVGPLSGTYLLGIPGQAFKSDDGGPPPIVS
jgi:hypothetical protein